MTFLNSVLALGTLAFAVPLIIHLLNRSQYRIVDWGAMIFLEQQHPSNSRKMDWKHLLLLLIRCLIPICLALAMSRPFLSGSSWTGTAEPTATVIILDDSLSMQSKARDGQTRWSLAIQYTQDILKSLPNGSEPFLILGGQTPEPVDATSLQNRLVEWSRNPSIAGQLDSVQATKMGLDWLNQQPLTRRQILYVSDFQSSDWSDESDTASELKRLANSQTIPPVLSWLSVSGPPSIDSQSIDSQEASIVDFRNYSIGETALAPKWFTEGQAVTALSTIHNHLGDSVESLAVSWYLDNERIDSQKITIAPRGTTRISTRFRAPEKDWHLLEVKLDGADDLEFDNYKPIPFRVQQRSQVFLIDGDLRSEPMQSESDFLRIALSPFSFSLSSEVDFFDTKVMPIDKLPTIPWKDANAIVLCNVPRLNQRSSLDLRNYVNNGGGVILFLGDKVDVDSWNQLPTLDQGGLRFFSISKEISPLANKPVDGPEMLTITAPESGIFRELSQATLASLSSVAVGRYTPVSILAELPPDRIISLSDGSSWIIRQNVGKGSVWVVTTSCDTSDSNLPTRPVFVPLMQKLVHAAANSQPSVEVLNSNTPWTIPFMSDANSTDLNASTNFKVKTPRKNEELITNRIWMNTRQIGLYEATRESRTDSERAYCWVEAMPSSGSKNPESGRSDLTRGELENIAADAAAKFYSSVDSFLTAHNQNWKGQEIGNWFWFAAVVCFLAEMAVAQSFSLRKSKTKNHSSPSFDSQAARGSL